HVALQAAAHRPDGAATARRQELGGLRRALARGDPARRRVPLEAARSPAALDGAHGVPGAVDARAPRARAIRRGDGYPRLLFAGVSAAAVSDDAPRAGRRDARRGDHVWNLFQYV